MQEATEGAWSPASPENVSLTTLGFQMPEPWKQDRQKDLVLFTATGSHSGSGAEPGADAGPSPPSVSDSVFWITKM